MQSTVPDLQTLALVGAYGIMFLGLLLIVVRPFFPGLLAITIAVAAYTGLSVARTGSIGDAQLLAVVGVALCAFAGLGSTWWSEKLGLRFTYVTPEVVWGAFMGLILAAILYLSLFWQIVAMFVGATVAAIGVQKRGFKDALSHGPMAIYWMLGPRGFQLLMALLVCDISLSYLLRPSAPRAMMLERLPEHAAPR